MNIRIRKLLSAAVAAATLVISVPFISESDALATYEFNTDCSYMYDMLETQAEKDFYNNLLEACNTVDDSLEDYESTPYADYGELGYNDRTIEVAWIFYHDHPEFFWMESGLKISSLYGLSFNVYPDYQDGTERMAAKEQIVAIENEYIAGALEYETPYDKAKYLYSALVSDLTYEQGDLDQSIASAFLEKKTVCAGYSRAYQLLCKAVGVDAVTLTSPVHGWNAVKLGTQWFIVDVTNGSEYYSYFLLSEEEMREVDIMMEAQYTMTTTVDGVEQTYTFYMHDIDEWNFPTYYDDFPECNMTYDEYLEHLAQLPIAIAGDINADGDFNVSDLLVMQKWLLNSESPADWSAGDLNADGELDIYDFILMRQALLAQ